MNSLMAAMSETGVVTGEDGLLNAYKHKREIMQEWRKDKSPHVRNFAEEYEKSLTSSIEHEKRRTDEELTLLKKRHYLEIAETISRKEFPSFPDIAPSNPDQIFA
jgi:beta-lactamase class D